MFRLKRGAPIVARLRLKRPESFSRSLGAEMKAAVDRDFPNTPAAGAVNDFPQ
jgi:hypothetical protein